MKNNHDYEAKYSKFEISEYDLVRNECDSVRMTE